MDKKVICGQFPELEARLGDEIRGIKQSDPLAPALVVVGSRALGLYVQRALAQRLGALVNVRVLTLDDLARELTGPGDTRVAPEAVRAWAVRDLTRELPEGDYFHAVAGRKGFTRTLLRTFQDISESDAAVDPEAVRSRKVREVLSLYAAYRERAKGIFDEDPDVLRNAAGNAAGLAASFGVDRVIFYGIYDLNPVQRRLVESISGSLDSLFLVPFADRPDFDYVVPTLDWLGGLGAARTQLEPAGRVCSNLALLQTGGRSPEPQDDGTVGFISAPGEAGEARAIAREVMTAARERDTSFSRMAVLMRQTDPYKRLLVEEFDRLEIPYWLSGGLPLAETREGRSLLMLAGLAGTAYPRRQVMQFLRFAPLDAEGLCGDEGVVAPDVWHSISAAANVIAGRSQWEGRLRASLEGLSIEESDHEQDRVAESRAAKHLLTALGTLFDGLERVPASGSARQLGEPLLALYTRVTSESRDREAVTEAAARLIESAEALGTLARDEFVAMLDDHLQSERVHRGKFGVGVHLLPVMESRGCLFDLVFVPGVVEKSFPARAGEDPILLDSERAGLNARGAGLPLKRKRAAEERLLFALATGAAKQRVVLTYPRLDPSTGKPRIPSVFMLRAAEACAGQRVNYEGLESVPGFERAALLDCAGFAPVAALSASELMVTLARSADPATALEARSVISDAPGTRRALAMLSSRHDRDRYDEFDGMVPGFVAAGIMKGETFRATELEEYAKCPYRFFHDRVLGVERFEEPEEEVTIKATTRGHLVHVILKDFYSRAADEGLLPLADETLSRQGDLLRECARAGFERVERTGECGMPEPWRREQQHILACLELLLEDERGIATGLVPSEYEASFGREGDERGPVSIDLGGGETIAFRGRIDRIDVGPGGALKVTDYKTGMVRQDRANPFLPDDPVSHPGLYVQAMIYLLAAAEWLAPGAPANRELAAELVFMMSAKGRVERLTYGGAAFDEHLTFLRQRLAGIKHSVEEGVFFPFPSKWCDYCDYALACPSERKGIYARKCEDPAAARVLALLSGEAPDE